MVPSLGVAPLADGWGGSREGGMAPEPCAWAVTGSAGKKDTGLI